MANDRNPLNFFSDAAPTAKVVDDATLIAIAAVRLSVKNLILVRALRDNQDFDDEWYSGAIRHEFQLLAAEKVSDTARVNTLLTRARHRKGKARHPSDYRAADVNALESRVMSLATLANKLGELANDADICKEVLSRARRDALTEIEANLAIRIEGSPRHNVLTGADRDMALLELRRVIEESTPVG